MKKIEMEEEEYKKLTEFFIELDYEDEIESEIYEIACKYFVTDEEKKAMERYKKDNEKKER